MPSTGQQRCQTPRLIDLHDGRGALTPPDRPIHVTELYRYDRSHGLRHRHRRRRGRRGADGIDSCLWAAVARPLGACRRPRCGPGHDVASQLPSCPGLGGAGPHRRVGHLARRVSARHAHHDLPGRPPADETRVRRPWDAYRRPTDGGVAGQGRGGTTCPSRRTRRRAGVEQRAVRLTSGRRYGAGRT